MDLNRGRIFPMTRLITNTCTKYPRPNVETKQRQRPGNHGRSTAMHAQDQQAVRFY